MDDAWKLVPKNPTAAMLHAMAQAWHCSITGNECAAAYAAALDAAPLPKDAPPRLTPAGEAAFKDLRQRHAMDDASAALQRCIHVHGELGEIVFAHHGMAGVDRMNEATAHARQALAQLIAELSRPGTNRT